MILILAVILKKNLFFTGIACNTRLAKVCSDLNKPNGQYFLPPDVDEINKFVKDLSIRKVMIIMN